MDATKASGDPIILERRDLPGAYDMLRRVAILEHPQFGRLLIAEGWGGLDSLSGGAYRWRHGFLAQLRPTDTLDLLESEGDEACSIMRRVLAGEDASRRLFDWDGVVIDQMAQRAGL